MNEQNTVFDDIMQGLHEIEEHRKGNIQLRSNTIAATDEDINVKFSKLPTTEQQAVRTIIDSLLKAGNQ